MDDLKKIIDVFCEHSGINASDIEKGSVRKDVCATRYMIYAYLHQELKMTCNRIGKTFGRTRESVLRGIRVLKGWMQYHEDVKRRYRYIVKRIEEGD